MKAFILVTLLVCFAQAEPEYYGNFGFITDQSFKYECEEEVSTCFTNDGAYQIVGIEMMPLSLNSRIISSWVDPQRYIKLIAKVNNKKMEFTFYGESIAQQLGTDKAFTYHIVYFGGEILLIPFGDKNNLLHEAKPGTQPNFNYHIIVLDTFATIVTKNLVVKKIIDLPKNSFFTNVQIVNNQLILFSTQYDKIIWGEQAELEYSYGFLTLNPSYELTSSNYISRPIIKFDPFQRQANWQVFSKNDLLIATSGTEDLGGGLYYAKENNLVFDLGNNKLNEISGLNSDTGFWGRSRFGFVINNKSYVYEISYLASSKEEAFALAKVYSLDLVTGSTTKLAQSAMPFPVFVEQNKYHLLSLTDDTVAGPQMNAKFRYYLENSIKKFETYYNVNTNTLTLSELP